MKTKIYTFILLGFALLIIAGCSNGGGGSGSGASGTSEGPVFLSAAPNTEFTELGTGDNSTPLQSPVAPVPEPSTAIIFTIGLTALAGRLLRKKRK